MASYEIEWKHSAEQDLRSIDRQYIPLILEEVESLADNPFPSQVRKLYGAEASYRILVGEYRVLYQIDVENNCMIIYHVRHRRESYRR